MNVFKAIKAPTKRIKRKKCECGTTMSIFQRGTNVITWRCPSCSSCAVDQIVKKAVKPSARTILVNFDELTGEDQL